MEIDKLIERVKEQMDRDAAEHCPSEVIEMQNDVIAALTFLNDELDMHKRLFVAACADLGRVNEYLGLDADDGGADPIIDAIEELKGIKKMDTPQLKKIHPYDFPIEIFLADLSTRAANVIRAELASFDRTAGTGMYDIEPPYTVRNLCMYSRSDMKRWPNFGKKCLNEVEENLRARGLHLWENHDERSLRLLREHKQYF